MPAKAAKTANAANTPPSDILSAIIKQHTEQVPAQQANTPFSVLDRLPEAADKPDLSGSTEKQRTQPGEREAVLKAIENLMAETRIGKDATITTVLTSAQHSAQAHLLNMLMPSRRRVCRGLGATVCTRR